jgi:4-amino-4-deoxy-L-arabinose transferase-like glycosyltransferase
VNRRERVPYIVLALGSAAYLYLFLRVLWRVGDEGTLVYGAQRVAEGAVPYRDFFEVMGPGAFYWLGFFFRVFGTSWLVTRAVLLITGVATTLILYWLARRLHPEAAILPAILMLVITIPLWPATNHHWDSNLFALLSFGAFLLWLDRSGSWLLLTAGGLAGVTTFFLQQKGVLLLAAYILLLWILQRKRSEFISSTVPLLCGYLVVVAVVVLSFYAAGALPDFVYANIIWPLSNYHKVNSVPYAFGLVDWYWNSWVSSLSSILSPAVAYSAASVLFIPLLMVSALPALLVILAFTNRVETFNRTTLPYWIAGSALWLSEVHRADMPHLIYGSPILLILCTYLCFQRRNRYWHYGLRVVALSTLLFVAFTALVALAARTRTITRRGTVYTAAKDDALEFLDQQTEPGEAVFIYPYYPMYYFLSGTQNPTRFSILMYHINTDAQFREAISALEEKKVRYVLWDTVVDGQNLKQWFPAYQHPSREKQLMEPYLAEHYNLAGYKNGFRLLERKSALPAAGNSAGGN